MITKALVPPFPGVHEGDSGSDVERSDAISGMAGESSPRVGSILVMASGAVGAAVAGEDDWENKARSLEFDVNTFDIVGLVNDPHLLQRFLDDPDHMKILLKYLNMKKCSSKDEFVAVWEALDKLICPIFGFDRSSFKRFQPMLSLWIRTLFKNLDDLVVLDSHIAYNLITLDQAFVEIVSSHLDKFGLTEAEFIALIEFA